MTLDEIRKAFRERGLKKVKIGGFDIDGLLRGKYVSLEKFLSVAEKGLGFCDVIFGWDIGDVMYDNARPSQTQGAFPDVLARVDLTTMRVTPWEPDTATFLLDFHTLEGAPHPACPRNLLKSVIARAKAQGFSAKFAAEFEFWLFSESPHSVRDKRYAGLQPLSPGMFGYSWLREGQQRDVVHDLMDTMRAFDIDIEALHTETGPGVYEAALRYDETLRAADKAALFKTSVKQVAFHHNLIATFMAKWNAQLPGSSGHLHQSLWTANGETNVFFDPGADGGLSATLRHYVGGQLALMPELTALFSPCVNSYKRYVPGVWAPLNASWGIENRTTAVRAIGGGKTATRVEYRQTAADINPYIAIAANLAAGLHGIQNRIDPGPPIQGNAEKAPGLVALPRSLRAANRALAESKAARELLGEGFVDHYVRTRDWEVRQYERAVTDWELERYFESI
ncbi:MAG: glutamine synthetase [Deltaproteobacteria bacterium]|nr:glutamine synthetase [Deltaproteobacteria bacterium]